MQINTMGLVLRAVRVGEADQILTVLTPGNGVLSASARGSLRLKNKQYVAAHLDYQPKSLEFLHGVLE